MIGIIHYRYYCTNFVGFCQSLKNGLCDEFSIPRGGINSGFHNGDSLTGEKAVAIMGALFPVCGDWAKFALRRGCVGRMVPKMAERFRGIWTPGSRHGLLERSRVGGQRILRRFFLCTSCYFFTKDGNKMSKVREFFRRKDVVFSARRYGIDALGAMAQGLFCTLLVGTILNTIGQQFHIGFLNSIIVTLKSGTNEISYTIGGLASAMVGPGIAIAIGYALHSPSLVLFSLIPVGFAANAMGGAGGPLAVYVIAIVACECGKLVSKETKVDILVTPIVTILTGIGAAVLVAGPIGTAAAAVGDFVKWATVLQPFFMGILVSVVVGIALTLPISSAAICAALTLTGLAGGAAVAGCCAQMVGFAVMSFRENRWGGLVAQGVGTSMLQMPNIVKNPRIWIPPTLASAITGPLATCLFHLEMNGAPVSSGMGTCGFVGQIGVYTGWVSDIAAGTKAAITAFDWLGMVLICFVLPGILSWIFCQILRKWGWIREGDLKLEL